MTSTFELHSPAPMLLFPVSALALLKPESLKDILHVAGFPGPHIENKEAANEEASSQPVPASHTAAAVQNDAPTDDDVAEDIAELTFKQASSLVKGCSPKSRRVLEAMVSGDTRYFQIKNVAAALGVGTKELTGVWAGLTRRTRTVTGEDEIFLIDWTRSEAEMDGDIYVDHRAELSETSYRSLRKALGLSVS